MLCRQAATLPVLRCIRCLAWQRSTGEEKIRMVVLKFRAAVSGGKWMALEEDSL